MGSVQVTGNALALHGDLFGGVVRGGHEDVAREPLSRKLPVAVERNLLHHLSEVRGLLDSYGQAPIPGVALAGDDDLVAGPREELGGREVSVPRANGPYANAASLSPEGTPIRRVRASPYPATGSKLPALWTWLGKELPSWPESHPVTSMSASRYPCFVARPVA